jgi:hypothetical protein
MEGWVFKVAWRGQSSLVDRDETLANVAGSTG